MLVGVALLPPTFKHWNKGILHYKQAKLRKDVQHSVPITVTEIDKKTEVQ